MSWVRRAVVRGDAAVVGVLGAAVGVGLLAGAAVGLVPPPGAAVAVLLGVGGVVVVARARAAYRRLLAQVVERHRGRDPGPSPVPWIDDALWGARNRFDPALDGPGVLLGELDPDVTCFGRDARGAFTEVTLRPVTPEERALAVVGEVPSGAAVPPEGDGPSLLGQLAATPGRFVAVGPRWPVCCGRPATLVSDRAADRDPTALRLVSEAPSPGRDERSDGGTHGFQCRACGRRYATDPAF